MAVTDPISDLLTQLRNAVRANKRRVELPSSKMKKSIVQILKDQHFVNDFAEVEVEGKPMLKIALKYTNGMPAISGSRRVSTPGLRRYVGSEKLPRVHNGYGIAIISTSKGIMTDKQAKKEAVGGEVLCYIW